MEIPAGAPAVEPAPLSTADASSPVAETARDEPTTTFPFLRLPIELRNMVYRNLLVSRHRVHLDCIDNYIRVRSGHLCRHRLDIHTAVLRVCSQLNAEALDILYGENSFVCKTVFFHPSALPNLISPGNRRRLRTLTIQHLCEIQKLNIDREDEYASDWDGMSDFSWDSNGNDDEGQERILAPRPPELFESQWRLVLQSLTSLTLTLIVECCLHQADLSRVLSNNEELNEYALLETKRFMHFYSSHVQPSVKVRHHVWCEDHTCACRFRDEMCAKIQRHVAKQWLENC